MTIYEGMIQGIPHLISDVFITDSGLNWTAGSYFHKPIDGNYDKAELELISEVIKNIGDISIFITEKPIEAMKIYKLNVIV